jgi:geranylgeranyl transferase type-2 subunit beta
MADEVELAADQHVRYIVTVEKVKSETTLPFPPRVPLTPLQLPTPPLVPAQKKDSFESLVMEHIRLNGAYWGLTTLDLLHKLHAVDAAEVVDWIMSCYHPESGTSPLPNPQICLSLGDWIAK